MIHHVVAPQAVPEGPDTVEHVPGALDELLLVEPRHGEGLLELVGGVGSVAILDLVVPDPEPERQHGALALLERLQSGDELLPEPRRRPVLDGEGGSLSSRGVFRPVDAKQLVAEEARARRRMAALAHLLEAQAERGAEVEEP